MECRYNNCSICAFATDCKIYTENKEAKEIIKKLLKYIFTPEGFEELDKDMIMKVEAFVKE